MLKVALLVVTTFLVLALMIIAALCRALGKYGEGLSKGYRR